MVSKQHIVYVTSSNAKAEENNIFKAKAKLPGGALVSEFFTFDVWSVPIKETLEMDLRVLVQNEVVTAYSQIHVPCIVEHAGLIFEGYEDRHYPGGLTKPLWNTFEEQFLVETRSAGRRAIARAVVAYCDGMSVRTFVGETKGHLGDCVKGSRNFYWDRVFIPEDAQTNGLTYSEIVEHPKFGLDYKVLKLSQSTKAMLELLSYLRKSGQPALWR